MKNYTPHSNLPTIPKTIVEGRGRVMDWDSINGNGIYTKTQARKSKIVIDETPCAQYQGQDSFVLLYKQVKTGQ